MVVTADLVKFLQQFVPLLDLQNLQDSRVEDIVLDVISEVIVYVVAFLDQLFDKFAEALATWSFHNFTQPLL